MFRYMALMWDAQSLMGSDEAEDFAATIQASASGWDVAFEGRGVKILVADRSSCFGVHRLCDEAGVVLGEVFVRLKNLENAVPAYDAKFNRLETWQALKSQGRTLCNEFWGNFVAFIVDEGPNRDSLTGGQRARFVFKDPGGTLPCYFTQHRGVQLVFSSVEDCRSVGLSFGINWDFVRHRAVHAFFEPEMPTLIGVSNVQRGECVRFDAAGKFVSRSLYWHPLDFVDASKLIVDPTDAARALRATVTSCVHSLARHHASLLAQTSGGLDSSIVLGCLSSAPSKPSITCYTAYAPNNVCDERRWARCAVRCGDFRHVEYALDPRGVSYQSMDRLAPTIEPASYYTQWQRSSVERQMAAEFAVTGTFTGDPGDATFCATTYGYAADHCFRRHGLGRSTFETALRVASRSDKTLWHVLTNVVRREVFGWGKADEQHRRSSFNRLVAQGVKANCGSRGDGSRWLRAGRRISEETRMRLGTLAFAPEFYDLAGSARTQTRHLISPLYMQPVMEMCLRIPVDIHFDGGRSRGLARRAFADVVPAPILRRQWKDRPMLFFDEIIERNLPFMREHLLDGAMMREGILDRAALELALKSGPTRTPAISSEVFTHLDTELWIRDCT
jgi:asparagine synthase (glutamine-hydrolysing)